MPAVLFPEFDHPALEERYASWQSQMLLKRDHSRLEFYDPAESASNTVEGIAQEHVLVVTDPLLLPSPGVGERLLASLGDAFAAVPGTNAAGHPQQQVAVRPYMTLREFEEAAREMNGPLTRIVWGSEDAGAFLCRTESLRSLQVPLSRVLAGRDVVIDAGAFVHRWASLRGQIRFDLLDRVPHDARSVLEFGCGEAGLGEALKKRQKCRVVGVELDREAAAIARKRIDDVYCGDVREIVSILHDSFDCIIGGDIIEHLDEPWSFLADLRRIASPGGRLLLSLPNMANASLIGDLLHGRFDYVYMGLACVGHVRFFTRRSLGELLTIAGWEVEVIEPQTLAETPEQKNLIEALRGAGIGFEPDEIFPTGFYVIARNPG